jgi:class 3 adenylate cyclase
MRVPRTFAFVDLSGFTHFTETQGDDAAGKLLAAFRAVARDVASERGVRIAKWLGDGLMTACAPLTLRIGLSTGYALLFEGDDYIGSAVNTAARLCDAAGAFEVLIPIDQVEDLPEGVHTIPHAPLDLRGFSEPVAVYTLSGDPVIADRNDTGELWTRSPFVM